jgi:hypothetical protein
MTPILAFDHTDDRARSALSSANHAVVHIRRRNAFRLRARSRACAVCLVLVAALALALSLSPVARASGPQSADPDVFTPVLQSVVGPVWPVKGSDGRWHTVYEVQLANVTSLGWNVRSVRIRAARGKRRIVASWSGSRVADVLISSATSQSTRQIAPGQTAVLHLQFTRPTRQAIPRAIVEQLTLVNAKPAGGGPPNAIETSPAAALVQRPAAVLGPPLQGDRWVAADGCCTARRHVFATQAYDNGLFTSQRFAIDWERLDAQGRLWTGNPKVLTNWPGYGAPVLAVANGTVVRAIDGLPDQVPGALPQNISIADADGNAVFLRLRGGGIVFYAHMIPGSLRVKVGERVRRGQVIGLVGNSGNSSAPHLHLHVVDRDAIAAANGLPYVFNRFTITGKIASTAAFNHAEETGQPPKLGPVRTGSRHDELSLDQVIVTWPLSSDLPQLGAEH